MDSNAIKCIFVRYNTKMDYKCYLPRKKRKQFVSIDITIFEDIPFCSLGRKVMLEPSRKGEISPLQGETSRLL